MIAVNLLWEVLAFLQTKDGIIQQCGMLNMALFLQEPFNQPSMPSILVW